MRNMNLKDILIIVLVLSVSVLWYRSARSNQKLESTTSILEEKQSMITRVTTENGQLKQEKQAAVVDSREKRQLAEQYKEQIKDLEENHDVKLKNLHSYYQAKLQTSSSGTVIIRDTTVVYGDSIKVYRSFQIRDSYLNMNGYFTNAQLNYEYTVMDSLSVAWHWTKKGIWPFKKRDKLMVSFSSSNPNTILTNTTSFAIVDKKKTRFTIGPYIGYGLEGLSLGLSIQKPLIQVRF